MPLQARKTYLARIGPKQGNQRKAFVEKTPVNPTEGEQEAFKKLQSHLASPSFLVHFDPKRQLYIDLDSSKIAFEAMVFHSRRDAKEKLPLFKKTQAQDERASPDVSARSLIGQQCQVATSKP